MQVSDIKRLRVLEEENAKLNKMFAQVSLENHAVKVLICKKGLVTAQRRSCVDTLVCEGLSVLKTCRVVGISHATYYRVERDWHQADAAVIHALFLKDRGLPPFW